MNLYLSDTKNIKFTLIKTNLSLDEIELIVGRFNKNSIRAGQLRGELIQDIYGKWIIRHHFTKKILWTQED